MRMYNYSTALSLALLAASPSVFAQTSAALRIACDGENAGATVTINDVVKGDCPLDVSVPPGNIRLRVSKNVNGNQERVFEQEFRMTAGTGKRIDVELGKPQTSLAAQKGVEDAVEAQFRPKEEEQLRALPALIKKAEGGDSAAMLRVGQVYEWGLAGNVDFKQAAKWYERAARAENPAGMSAYATYLSSYRSMGGVSRNPSEAIAMWEKAAARGDGSAMNSLGFLRLFGNSVDGIPENREQAKIWFEKGANAGNYEAMEGLVGWDMTSDKAAIDQWNKKAFPIMQSLASDGYPTAIASMAIAYKFGAVIGRNTELSTKFDAQYFRYEKKAAASGDLNSILRLASMYEEGRYGAPKDKAMAIQLARKAAAQGDKDANTYLQKLLAQ